MGNGRNESNVKRRIKCNHYRPDYCAGDDVRGGGYLDDE